MNFLSVALSVMKRQTRNNLETSPNLTSLSVLQFIKDILKDYYISLKGTLLLSSYCLIAAQSTKFNKLVKKTFLEV